MGCGAGVRSLSEANRAALRRAFVSSYDTLSQRLTQRLGSPETAADALHDAYLRLESMADISAIRSPKDYLFRVAVNIATDRHRSEARLLSMAEIERFFELPDDAPDASRVVEARSEMLSLERAMQALPERRRLIFKAVLLDNVPRQDLAKRFWYLAKNGRFRGQAGFRIWRPPFKKFA